MSHKLPSAAKGVLGDRKSPMLLKGIEGLPFKYITLIVVATIVIAAMLLMLGQFEATAKAMTQTYNGTLHETLSGTLAKALSR